MKWICKFIAITIAALVIQSHADVLKVGLSQSDYPPFYFSVEDNKLEGAAIEIAEALASQLGHSLEYQRYPWKRVQHYLKTGQLDMVILYFKTHEREKDVIYSDESHLTESTSLFVPVDGSLDFNGDLQVLNRRTVYGIRGYYYGDAFEQASVFKRVLVNNEQELLKQVSDIRRQAVGIGNQPALEFYAAKMGLNESVRFLVPPVYEGKNYLAFSRQSPKAEQWAKAFSAQLHEYKKSADYHQILDKYGFKP